ERAVHGTGPLNTALPALRVTEEVRQRTTPLDTGRGLQGRARISTRTGEAQAGGNLREKARERPVTGGPGHRTARYRLLPPITAMQNPDIARLFDEVADLLEIQDASPS